MVFSRSDDEDRDEPDAATSALEGLPDVDDEPEPDVVVGEDGGGRVAPQPRQGVYVLQDGDTPGSLALAFYRRPSAAREIALANRGVSWEEGAEITLPPGAK